MHAIVNTLTIFIDGDNAIAVGIIDEFLVGVRRRGRHVLFLGVGLLAFAVFPFLRQVRWGPVRRADAAPAEFCEVVKALKG